MNDLRGGWTVPLGELAVTSEGRPGHRAGCTAEVPTGAQRCPGCGGFQPGNGVAVTTGLYARNLTPELLALHDEARAFLDAAIADEGEHADDIPARRLALLNYRARLHRRILQIDGALEGHGILDRSGAMRTGWIQRLESLIAAAKGLDTLLGLERRPKRVPASPQEYLHRLHEKVSNG